MKWKPEDLERLIVIWQTSSNAHQVVERMREGGRYRHDICPGYCMDILYSQVMGQIGMLRKGGVKLKRFSKPKPRGTHIPICKQKHWSRFIRLATTSKKRFDGRRY